MHVAKYLTILRQLTPIYIRLQRNKVKRTVPPSSEPAYRKKPSSTLQVDPVLISPDLTPTAHAEEMIAQNIPSAMEILNDQHYDKKKIY